jgi:kynurenine formamidase
MTNLAAIPVDGARFTAIPAPVRGTGTFPVRALAVVPGDAT